MSAMRMHKLRVQAVQKLARGYAMDEVASSVVIMQGGTVFDDLAQRVLKVGMHYLRKGRLAFLPFRVF